MAVRVAVIGCGKIAERASLPNLINYKDKAEVKVLCDIDAAKARALKDKFQLSGAEIETNWKKVVKRKDIDVVFVDTPNYLHEEMAVAACKHKKHVLVEKPIAIFAKAADKMAKAAAKNGVYLMVEQTQRFDPVHQAAKKILDSGVLGKIHNIRGRIGHAGPEYWSEGKAHWFYDKSKSGGGAMVDIGVHITDLVRWFAGKKIVEVFATIRTIEKDVKVDDNATVLFKFEDGTKGEIECSWTTRPYEVTTAVYGSKGKMTTSIGTEKPVRVVIAKTGKGDDPNCILEEIYPELGSTASGWENAVHCFIDCVITKNKPLVSGEEGRATMAVINAAYESSAKGKWVKVK
ncbi:MAG: Gfo/Idh/MocA family oxidoreductase [Candidatus Omnitrophica bacterium]|nr:Gfo/Idh/MocA family oxidoreductase [Candidatus Omnitrophota bacterium]